MITKKHLIFVSVFVLVVLIDQLVKLIIRRYFEFTKNYGAGFGILQHQTWLLILISLVVIGIILFCYKKIPELVSVRIFVALILGGVVGNLIDRIAFGYVIDFVRIWIWPAFNIADIASTVGVIGLIIYLLKKK